MRRLRQFAWLCFGLAATQAPALAADKPNLDGEAWRYYFPNAGEPGERVVQPGEEIVRRPVVWALSAQIQTPVEIQTSAGSVLIGRDTILPIVKISKLPGETGDVIAYCTAAPRFKPKTMGLMFGVLGAKAVRSLTDGRKCLFDKDGDGSAEFAFLLDDGTAADRTPQRIAPVPLHVIENREIGPGDYVRFTLRRASRPSFKADIFENGKQISVGMQRADTVKGTEFPTDVEIFGAKFTILARDDKSGAVTVKWIGSDQDNRIAVRSEVVYIYHYTYY